MGRKIPAKKHRGVKDPLVQQARRLQRLQGRVNSPPRDPDEQPVPRSVLRLFPAARPAARPARPPRPAAPLGALRRGRAEGARAFSQRITAAVRALTTPAAALRYPADMEEDEEEHHWERAGGRRRGAGAGTAREPPPNRKLRRRERLRRQRAEAQRSRLQDASDKPQYEHVPFGEVASRPPQLPKPVKVGGGGEAGGALRREEARRAAVEAYRALKRRRAQLNAMQPIN